MEYDDLNKFFQNLNEIFYIIYYEVLLNLEFVYHFTFFEYF